MDVDAQNEELADLLMDLSPAKGDGPRERDFGRQRGGSFDSGGEEVFEEGGFHALREGVGDGEFDHVIAFFTEGDEVVVDAGLVFFRVVEVEGFRLDVFGGELLELEFGEFGEEARFLWEGHAPYYDGAVFEEEDLGGGDVGVEVFGGVVIGVGGAGFEG